MAQMADVYDLSTTGAVPTAGAVIETASSEEAKSGTKNGAGIGSGAGVGTGTSTGAPVDVINREFQEKSTLKRAHEMGLPYINLSKTPLNPDYLRVLDIETVRKARVVPFFKVGKSLRVAVDDQNRAETVEVLQKLREQGFNVSINLASLAGVDYAINVYDKSQKYQKIELVESVEVKSIKNYQKEISQLSDLSKKLEEITAEEGLNMVDIGVMKTGASDAHYEPSEKVVTVRFRIDGMLHKVFELSPKVYLKLAEQIKYRSKMSLNIYTIPQDGRYVFEYNGAKVAVRTATIPTPYGESFVCRYLPSNRSTESFEELGYQGTTLHKLQSAMQVSQGMILVTGPTGSGKSTTLYSLLNQLNTGEKKIITLEDPVEYYVNGVIQSQINEKKGYNFASGLRSILRNDPDVVMVGEIRDLETAETAAQAALTGHIVLSTLHTNSAIETIPRLINMGLPPYMVAPAVTTIVAQRLVRRVCPHCGTFEPIAESEKQEFAKVIDNLKNVNPGAVIDMPANLPQVHGCEKCSHTGYSGRLVVSEIINITSPMKSLIMERASSVKMIMEARKDGFTTMREDGFLKVAQGLTTLEEIYRVTNIK